MEIRYPFHSLEDYLISKELDVDGQLDDGWGAIFPVKGREIEATVLFSDISRFTARTKDLSPVETLVFVNNFFAWITAEAIRGRHGIVDKYIGDEMMIVFSTEFGSEDPFAEAIESARWMVENDSWGFSPHIGLASGRVVVGYVGTPLRYNCSVVGLPVAMAARCAGVKADTDQFVSAAITFPAVEWGSRDFDTLFPPIRIRDVEGNVTEQPHGWRLLDARDVPFHNLGATRIREIVSSKMHIPSQSPEDRAQESVAILKQYGSYRPRNE